MSEDKKRIQIAIEDDYLGWLRSQIALIDEGNISDLDLDNIKEELLGLARGEEYEIERQLISIQKNLLECKYQPSEQTESCRCSIVESLTEIEIKLEGNTTLKNFITDELMLATYKMAVSEAWMVTRLEKNVFPEAPEWDLASLLDWDFCDEWMNKYEEA